MTTLSDKIRAAVEEAERVRRYIDGDGAGFVQRQIEHARDVLERHEELDHWTPDGPESECSVCAYAGSGDWPCPEILSLAKAWGVEP